jgi:steroid 5-alpha reductase family enzyme
MFYVLLAVAAVITAAGFYKFVYFISIGYAFSVVGLAIAMLIGFRTSLTLPVAILLVIVAVYAARLGIFVVIREYKNVAYRKVLDEASTGFKKIPFFATIPIWIFCSVLYVMQVSPVFFRLQNGLQEAYAVWLYAGIVVVIIGFLLQTVADAQKNKAKKANPKTFCRQGLFKVVRCPNYFGEILVWSGVLISSLPCLTGWKQIAFSLVGYIGLVYVMFGSTRRLELRQNKNYGSDPAYQEYGRTTPILIPMLPLYTVADWKWLGK